MIQRRALNAVRGLAIAVFLPAAMGLAPGAGARDFRVDYIPNGAKFSCLNCHTTVDGGPRNVFGQAVELLVTPDGTQEFWGPALAALDSDGDHFSNGAELQDPAGTWRKGQPNPGTFSAVTDPGLASSHPAATASPTPSATPTRSPTATPSPSPSPAPTLSPTASPTPLPPPSTREILDALLGKTSPGPNFDLNGDQRVDIADALGNLLAGR